MATIEQQNSLDLTWAISSPLNRSITLLWRMELGVGSFSPKGDAAAQLWKHGMEWILGREIIVIFKDNFQKEEMNLKYFFLAM